MLGSQVRSTCPTGPQLWYTFGTVKSSDAVMGANSAGLMIRNPLEAESVKV